MAKAPVAGATVVRRREHAQELGLQLLANERAELAAFDLAE